MDYLSYTPSCEAYIETRTANGSKRFYDISQDITNLSVTRNVDDASSFKITLANKNRKYNGLFSAMDRIAIYASKTDRHRLLTGYITEVDVFTLYSGSFHISGKCSLYQLQRMYWDPGLTAVIEEFGAQYSQSDAWEGAGKLAHSLIVNVGGWSSSNVNIGGFPPGVKDWAMRMYAAQASDFEQSEKILEAFDETLHKSSMRIASGYVDTPSSDSASVGNEAAKTAKPVGGSHSNGAKFHQKQDDDVNCGATAFTIAVNIMLGLTGKDAFQNLSVWRSSAFGSDSTVRICEKGRRFLEDNGLSNRLAFNYAPNDITNTEQLRAELKKGNVVVISSGGTSLFRNADGSSPRSYPEGHFIMFYNYSGETYFANDPAVFGSQGAGVPYSEGNMKQWLDGREFHTAAILSIR